MKEMYIDIQRRLTDAIRRKCLEKWRTSSWFLLHDNAAAHMSVLIKDFLAKNKVTTLEHPSYSLDLTATDFYLFARLKSALKGRRFCDSTDVIKNATEELKMFSQSGFQECVQHLCSR
jgi:transposase